MRLNGSIKKLRILSLVAVAGYLCLCECKAQNFSDSSGMDGGLAGQVLASAKEYKSRTIYSSLSPQVIDATPDARLCQVINDYMRSKMNWTLSNETEVLQNESEAARAVYVVSQVEAEVNNGGFSQLYSGSAARLGDMAEESFRLVKAPLFAALIKKAHTIYKQEGISDNLKALDEEFFNLYDREELGKLKVSYIRKSKKAFKAN